MKKIVMLSLCMFLFIAFFSVIPLERCNIIYTNIIYVDDDNTEGPWDGTIEHPYHDIRDGVMNASSGYTVFVFNGVYTGVRVNKTINLTGENRNYTIINGLVLIVSDLVNITGFTIQNSSIHSPGVYVTSDHNTIYHNIIINCGWGIWLLDSSSNNSIIDNIIKKNWRFGIELEDSANNKIIENIISDNWDAGITIHYYSHDNNISRNIIKNNDKGLDIGDITCDNIDIFNNTICNNKKEGISLYCNNISICRNDIINNGGEGLVLRSDSNNIIDKNTISNNDKGIGLEYSDNNSITSNIISNNFYGIWLAISSDNTIISNNSFSKNNCGLYLSGSSENEIISNTFIGNKLTAFYVNCINNSWNKNYWDRFRLFPKPIFGIINLGFWFPQINFDWHPAQKPYYIEG